MESSPPDCAGSSTPTQEPKPWRWRRGWRRSTRQLAGQPDRTLFVTLNESYHGDTVGAASLGYSEPFHRHIRSLLFGTIKTPPPHLFRFQQRMAPDAADQAALAVAQGIFEQHRNQIAALVIEPLMQGAAGMWSHSAAYLRAMVAMARAAGALVIVDEVATGFGRTGKMFACDHAGVSPDLLCLGKGITGGYLPLAATLTTARVFEAFMGRPEGIPGLLLRPYLHWKSAGRRRRDCEPGNFSRGAGNRADPAHDWHPA